MVNSFVYKCPELSNTGVYTILNSFSAAIAASFNNPNEDR